MIDKTLLPRVIVFILIGFFVILSTAQAAVSVSPLFGTGMVIQRDKPVPVYGTAAPGATVTVSFNGQVKNISADAQGNWTVNLDAMAADVTGRTLTIEEAGGNTITIQNVVVGDVWVCSGQSNMAFGLGGCDRPGDVAGANFPGIRQFGVPLVTSEEPSPDLSGYWSVCSPSTANGFSALAFYFARTIYQDQGSNIPIGLIVSSVGGTRIDPWLAPEGVSDIPVIQPLFSQAIMPWGPFSLFNGMVYPLAPYGIKGAIWYQGENSESTVQSADSYYLKMKALAQGWKRLWGMDDFAFYFVQIANWGALPANSTPVLISGGWDADTRLQQANAMALPHSGMASAIDIGESNDMHPKDKLDLGERLALWALKNEYGRSVPVPSGPVLIDVALAGSTVVCSFDYTGSGLMVGLKIPYQPTQEITTGTLFRFSIAGANGVWYPATAVISNDTVRMSSASVGTPRKIAYACWQNPLGCNLYNREGLPASPFYVDDVTVKYTITATANAGGSISPSGSNTLLKRMTALYTITPTGGNYIYDVKVDGTSVGSVSSYTFDPVYANHTIEATFTSAPPVYTVATSGTAGGTVSPSGAVTITQGMAQIFTMVPDTDHRLISVNVDGAPVGSRNSVRIADVKEDHTVSAVFAAIPEPGTGTGLRGDYYEGKDFDIFRVSRTDATVNFNWGYDSPDPVIPPNNFSVRWTGSIEPQFSETYTFYLDHNDGARLWVNNQQVINNWSYSGNDSGTISLTAGQKVAIKLEYYDNLDAANCKLEWKSTSLPRELVPQSQLYPATGIVYTITASVGTGGEISPDGTVLAYEGDSRAFDILPATGYVVTDVIVDDSSIGAVSSHTFTDITADHTIAATFGTLPSYRVSGVVTRKDGGTAIAGASVGIYDQASHALGNPPYSATTDVAGYFAVDVPVGTWYARAGADGYFTTAAREVTIANAPETGINFALSDSTRTVPRTNDLLFSVVTDSLPASGNTGNWPTYMPAGQTLTTIGNPTVEMMDGVKWEKNVYADYDGFLQGQYASAIACNGVTIVAAISPEYISVGGEPRGEIVDIFYKDLYLAALHGDAEIVVCHRGYHQESTGYRIPDGQKTILSLVVQPGGNISLYANGNSVWNSTTGEDYTQLLPDGMFDKISVGRNAWDGWSTFSGHIGDVFVYKTALSDNERETLEADLIGKFISGGPQPEATDPVVSITNQTQAVMSGMPFVAAGTNNANVTGTMWATNAANGQRVEFPAAHAWIAPAVDIEFNENVIFVFGSNLMGNVTSDAIVVAGIPEPGMIAFACMAAFVLVWGVRCC